MASIKRTTTKKGEARYRVMWRVDGRVVEEWHRTLATARERRAQVELASLGGHEVDPRLGRESLDDYFGAWLPARLVRGRPLRPSTRNGYEDLWRRTIASSIGRRRLWAIRPETVRKWHGDLVARAGHDQAAKAYRLLHAVTATAEADELIRANPCRIRGAGQERAAERPMPSTALVLALADAIGDRYRALVLTVGFSSTRTGEALGLRRRDVDILQSEIHILVQAQELTGRGRTQLDYTKNNAGRRIVAVPRLVVDALDRHLRSYTAPNADAPVFTGPRGGPLRRNTLCRAWRAAKQATGAPTELRLYDLRHHAATLTARMPGITTKELMARIGHSSLAAALRYQHATAERDRAVASFLDEQIAAVEQPPRAPAVEVHGVG